MIAFQKVRKGLVTLAGVAYFVGEFEGQRVRVRPANGGKSILVDNGGNPRECYPDDPTTEAHEGPVAKPA